MREYGNTLDDESFRTLLTGVECVLDSQLLTTPSSYPRNSDPLTPSHVLTLKSRVFMPPPGNFQKTDVCLRRRWKRIQYFSKVFWSRWRKESTKSTAESEMKPLFGRFSFSFSFFFFAHVAFLLVLLFSRILISSIFC